jgi:vacuolar-type H+-ATPase subunit H
MIDFDATKERLQKIRALFNEEYCGEAPKEFLEKVLGLVASSTASTPQNPDLLERLADLEHQQWSEFIDYLIRFAPIHGEKTAKDFWHKYYDLAQTPYEKLPEKAKESARQFARKVLTEFERQRAPQNLDDIRANAKTGKQISANVNEFYRYLGESRLETEGISIEEFDKRSNELWVPLDVVERQRAEEKKQL